MSSTARSWRTSWASHANARTSKRWNNATIPAVHSVWCMFIASTPSSLRRAACRSSGSSMRRRRCECTRRTSGAGVRPLQVQRELEVRAELAVQLDEPGNPVADEPARWLPLDPQPCQPGPYDRVVDEHDLAVAGHPGVGLEAGRALVEGPPERGQRVLGQDGPGSPMREGDRPGHGAILPGDHAPKMTHLGGSSGPEPLP